MGYIGNAPYQGLVTGDNVLDGSITAQDLAPGAAVPSQTGNSGKYLTTDGTNASWGALSSVRVTSIDYPGDDTATLPAGGATLTLIGTGFAATPMVFVDGTLAPSVSFVSSTQITFVAPAKSAGTYHLYVVNPDGATAIFVNGISYSGVPTWTTAAGSLGTYGSAFSIQLQATSDSAVTYALSTGSTLPAGVTLSSGGMVSGTINTDQTFSFSVDAIDAENQETARSFSVSIAASDANFRNTVLLLPGNGANNATNNTFIDSSGNNFSISRAGNTTQGTFSPFSQTGWGNYFDGSGDYLTFSSNTSMNFGTSNFTIEGWFYTGDKSVSAGASRTIIGNSGNSYTMQVYISTAGYLTFGNTGSTFLQGATDLANNTWHHFAIARSGTGSNQIAMWVDGSRVALGTNSQNYTSGTIYLGSFDASNGFWNGYLSNLRIVNGTAVYSPSDSTITVPTAQLTAVTNTSLLTCQSNRFRDASANNFTITRNGDVSVQAFSPFNPTAEWSAATNGGSGYFDGSGDYLTTPNVSAFQFGSGDFTVEMWIYLAAPIGTRRHLFHTGNNSSGQFNMRIEPSGAILVFASDSGPFLFNGSAALVPYQWNHIAFSRSGSTNRIFINGAVDATATNSYSYSGSGDVQIGFWNADSQNFLGYMSSLRVVKGTAVYTGAFTPPTAPLTAIANTSLLLNFTNAGIYDATSKNVLETVGDAKISTAVSKFGGSSMYFDGTGDYANTAPTLDLEFGGGDFTIEAWIYPAVTTRMALYHGSSGSDWSIGMDFQSQKLCVWASSNGSTWNLINADGGGNGIGTITISANAWTHVAFVRSGTTWQTYINGVRDLNLTGISGSVVNRATSGKSIAKWFFSNGVGVPGVWNGYIQDFRITKGVARYTSNFTPPTTAHKLR